MAVTTTKTNIMTIIEEDGGDPTGAGGKGINDNFKKIDDLFDGDVAQCAKFAPIASFAPVSSGVDYTVGTTPYPVAAWGSSFKTKGAENNGEIYLGKIAPLPAFGHYAYTVKLICIGGQDVYLEYIVTGTGPHMGYVKKIQEIDIHNSHAALITSNDDDYSTEVIDQEPPSYLFINSCWFMVSNSSLYCGVFGEYKYGSIVHATVYPAYVDRTAINSYDEYIGDNANAVHVWTYSNSDLS